MAGNGSGVCEVAFLKAKILKMNNIQQYIDLLKAEQQNATKKAEYFRRNGSENQRSYYDGVFIGILLSIEKAELLLKHDTGASTQ